MSVFYNYNRKTNEVIYELLYKSFGRLNVAIRQLASFAFAFDDFLDVNKCDDKSNR